MFNPIPNSRTESQASQLEKIKGGVRATLLVTGLLLTGCQSINVQPSSSSTSSQDQSPITQTITAPKPTPSVMPQRIENAEASVYGLGEAGTTNITATQEPFDPNGLTVASGFKYSKEIDPEGKYTQYPMGTILRITNPKNGQEATVKVNDKGNLGSGAKAYNPKAVVDMTPGVCAKLGVPAEGIIKGLIIEKVSEPTVSESLVK